MTHLNISYGDVVCSSTSMPVALGSLEIGEFAISSAVESVVSLMQSGQRR